MTTPTEIDDVRDPTLEREMRTLDGLLKEVAIKLGPEAAEQHEKSSPPCDDRPYDVIPFLDAL